MTSASSPTGAIGDRSPSPGLAFTVLAIVQATLIFTITLINVPLPKIADEFTLTSADLLLVLAAYGLPFSGLLLFGGRLADRYRGRFMFVIGLLVFGAASAGAAIAPSYEVLVAMRFCQGVGGALTAPAAMAVLRVLFPDPTAFGRAMATWGGVSVIGSVMGFMVSGAVTSWVSWRWMFLVPVAVALLGLLSARSILPAGDPEPGAARPGLDLPGAVLATLGISLSSFGLIRTGDHGWTTPEVYQPLLVGAVLLAAFFFVERIVRDPLLPLSFLRSQQRVCGLIGMLLAAAGAGGLISFVLSLFLQQILGWTPLMTAGAFLPFAIVLIVVGQFAAPIVGRFGPGPVMVIGLVIAAIGLGLLALLDRETIYLSGLMPGLILLAGGGSLTFSGAAVLSTADVPPHQAGLAGGVMNTAMELGPTVGLATLMSVAALQPDVVDGFAWAFGTAAAAFLVMAALALALTRAPKN